MNRFVAIWFTHFLSGEKVKLNSNKSNSLFFHYKHIMDSSNKLPFFLIFTLVWNIKTS